MYNNSIGQLQIAFAIYMKCGVNQIPVMRLDLIIWPIVDGFPM